MLSYNFLNDIIRTIRFQQILQIYVIIISFIEKHIHPFAAIYCRLYNKPLLRPQKGFRLGKTNNISNAVKKTIVTVSKNNTRLF